MPEPTERIRAVGFDLDGTLIDTMPDLAAAVNLMLATLGARELPDDRVRSFVGHGVEQLVRKALTESLGGEAMHAARESAALMLFRRLYSQGLFKRSRVYPEVADSLRALHAAGLRIACITNKSSEFALPLLQQAGLAPHLAFTVCADRAEDRKPAPRMLLSACSRLGIMPSQLLYVGDSPLDIAAARAAGCPSLAVTYGYAKEPLGGAGAERLIDTMSEVVRHCLGDSMGRSLNFTGAAG